MQPAHRFIAATLAISLGALVAVAALNAWVDPFLQYHAPGPKARFVTGFARHINAGLARNANYDSVLVGSSYTMNFRNSDFDREFGGTTVSLAMPGMFVSEGAKALRFAMQQREIKQVFFGLDYFAFVEADNKYEFPNYLWDRAWWNDAPYLLSVDTLKRSAYQLLGRGPDNYNTDADSPWNWAARGARFGRDRALADFNQIRARPQSKRYTASDMEQIARRELLPLIASHPQTQFELFLPPYSVLTWKLDAQRGDLQTLFAFRMTLAQMLAEYPNAQLHDFQAWDAVICDLGRYSDVGHYGPDENRAMVAAMRGRTFVADRSIVAANNSRLAALLGDAGCERAAPGKAP